VESQFPGASEREQFQEVLRGLLDWLVSGLVEGTVEAADAASVSSVEDVRAHPRRLASFTLPAHATNRALKQFLHHTLYYSEPMAGERRRSATQIAELFEFWVAHPDKLPANYVESLASSPVHRVVCDYIAGMTDGYFLRCYQHTIGGAGSL
jgi:dGTPase